MILLSCDGGAIAAFAGYADGAVPIYDTAALSNQIGAGEVAACFASAAQRGVLRRSVVRPMMQTILTERPS
jgi:hypothetical protein